MEKALTQQPGLHQSLSVKKKKSSLLFIHLPAVALMFSNHTQGRTMGSRNENNGSHWHFICPGTPMCCGCLWRCYDWKSLITEAYLHSMSLSSCNTQQVEKEVLLSKVILKCLSVPLFRPRPNKFLYEAVSATCLTVTSLQFLHSYPHKDNGNSEIHRTHIMHSIFFCNGRHVKVMRN